MTETKQQDMVFNAELEKVPEREVLIDMLLLDEEDRHKEGTVDESREKDRSDWTQSIDQGEVPIKSESLMSEKAQQYLKWINNEKLGASRFIDLHYELKEKEYLKGDELEVVKKALSQARADYWITRLVPNRIGDWTLADVIGRLEDEYKSGLLSETDVKRAAFEIKKHLEKS